jgi:hypothetical protein
MMRWCLERHGEDFADRYPIAPDQPAAWAEAVRSPGRALRVDLGWLIRDRFTSYVIALADAGGRYG